MWNQKHSKKKKEKSSIRFQHAQMKPMRFRILINNHLLMDLPESESNLNHPSLGWIYLSIRIRPLIVNWLYRLSRILIGLRFGPWPSCQLVEPFWYKLKISIWFRFELIVCLWSVWFGSSFSSGFTRRSTFDLIIHKDPISDQYYWTTTQGAWGCPCRCFSLLQSTPFIDHCCYPRISPTSSSTSPAHALALCKLLLTLSPPTGFV